MISKVNIEHQKQLHEMNENFDLKMTKFIQDEIEYKSKEV